MIEFAESPDAKAVFHEAYRDCLTPEMEEGFLSRLETWDAMLLRLNGSDIGAIACHTPYYHIGILPSWRHKWATKNRLFTIANLAAARGCTMTQVRTGSPGEKMVSVVGMTPAKQLAGGCEYAYAA